RAEWRDHHLVERHSEEGALMLDDTDDLIRKAADAKLTPDWIEPGKEELRHLVADDHYARSELRFLLREDAAAAQIVLLDREVVAVDGMRVYLPRPREWRGRPEILAALDGPASAVRQNGDDRADVLLIEARALLP